MRKISPSSLTHSQCKQSLDWLRVYAEKWIKQNVEDPGEVWLPDDNHFALTTNFPQGNKITDVILTGSFLTRLLELPYWKLEEMRLWTFSSVVKKALVEFLDLDPKLIGVIPHLSCSRKELNIKNAQFVYVGRLNWTKNIEALLYLVSYLQENFSAQITLNLVGLPDDLPDESLGRVEAPLFESELQQMISKLPWKNLPQLSGYQKDWKSLLSTNSHFITLSTSMYEDFGVASNEAAEIIPTIISAWGGHWNQSGAHLLSTEFIFHSFEPEWIKKRKTELLAQTLIKKDFQTPLEVDSYIPVKTHFKEVSDSSLKFIDRYSPEILLFFRESLDTFADTEKGKSLFQLYRQHFALTPHFDTLHVYGDHSKYYPFTEGTLLVPERDLIYNVQQKLLFRDYKIQVNGISPKLDDFLVNSLNRSDREVI